MDNTSVVSHIATSSIESSNRRDSSRGQAGDVEGGRGRDLGSASNMVGSMNNRGNMVGSSNNRSDMVGSISQAMVSQTSISQTMVASISSIAQTMVTISSISQDIGISLSFPLGNMDGSSRVSNIATSSSIESSYGRDSSRGQASSGEGGRGSPC